ncbi:TolB amino-terminal domain-containing protein [Aliiruegeria lutimaris]|uniref:TolB amino-terminal domain-containing protein n=2 Tax=Aliiruegeria lutimaris TaxID=571298 RepID=A0A1G9LV88_9RHOB|nr:TolB amino-terminal domain-containing protein [Aliiruegeria lutimaris]
MDLIACFARNPGVVLTRDQLIDTVWGGRVVSDSAISSRINAARAALGDDGAAQRIIRTLPRRGFRFEPTVTTAGAGSALLAKPSIAVLPFENMSGDPDQQYFSDGITDDIITELSRYDELFVISRQSSFAYRDTGTSPAAIARDLGVRYIANGSVRRAGRRIRVTAQLIDPKEGRQLWAERYDRDLEDVFEVQDEITTVIVNCLAGQITRLHYQSLRGQRPEAIDAYDHVLRAMSHGLRVSPEHNSIAISEAEQAIAIDPHHARGHAFLGFAFINAGNNFWVSDPAESFRLAFEASRTAVAADGRDPWAQATLGIAELWHNRAHDRCISHMLRAMELNPSNAHMKGLYSFILPFCGQPELALSEMDAAMRMHPHFPDVFQVLRGRALLFLGRYDEALESFHNMSSLMPGHSNALGYAAVAYGATGRWREAEEAVKELVSRHPHYTLAALRRHLPFARQDDRKLVLDMLERAGLPV